MAIEDAFDIGFIAKLTAEEKQIQQNYRPVIGVHKWFARRPGALFRGLLLAEFCDRRPLSESYFETHQLNDITVADPFMGGGTTLFEANRIGCNVAGFDTNPMAFWVVRQELVSVDREAFRATAQAVVADIEDKVRALYETRCVDCGGKARVKYFLWVKQQRCEGCSCDLDLFPGYLIASDSRHTDFVLHCPMCKGLVQLRTLPARGDRAVCPRCASSFDWATGPASRNRYQCSCGHVGRYPAELKREGPPRHRMFGLEYNCEHCPDSRRGRWFKTVDDADLRRFRRAATLLSSHDSLLCPDDAIPDGDETKRLHRWGYHKYRELFNERQLLGLGLLARRIEQVEVPETRHALATVFSDFLRYQNMLCRYDTDSLKCQDIFSVHGFPVGLIQCENNLLGISGAGSGSFRHFVEKYDRAKAYCEHPFETVKSCTGRKRLVHVAGERIEARLVDTPHQLHGGRKTMLRTGSLADATLAPGSFDAVFTDPPYFDNVQYAELMDFCYVWLRLLLGKEFAVFRRASTRTDLELTGNKTTGKDLEHFTAGLSGVFRRAATALKPGGAFVFTYHHNDLEAYVPIVVATLDAGLVCTASLPCPGEMTASLHINGTGSSVMDSIMVCRARLDKVRMPGEGREWLLNCIEEDRRNLSMGGITCSRGDLYCLAFGHAARLAIGALSDRWDASQATSARMHQAHAKLEAISTKSDLRGVVEELLAVELVPAGCLPFCEVL